MLKWSRQYPAPQPPDMLAALIGGQALVETANLKQLSRANQAKVDRMRDWLKQIAITGELPALERSTAGQTLAHLGDDRPGVGPAISMAP